MRPCRATCHALHACLKIVLVRQCPTRFGGAVDTTLTVRLDTQLKDDAERTLDSLGLLLAPV